MLEEHIAVQYGLDDRERETLGLIHYYEKLRRRYSGHEYMVYSRHRDPRHSRFWPSFYKLNAISLQKETDIPDPRMFIRAQFEIVESDRLAGAGEQNYCPPQYLFSRYAWRRYRKYVSNMTQEQGIEKNTDIQTPANMIKFDLENSVRLIREYSSNVLGKPDSFDCKAFFEDPESEIWISHMAIGPHFMSVCKSAHETGKINLSQELVRGLDIYRKEVLSNKSLRELAKRLLGEEFHENTESIPVGKQG